MRHKTPDGKAYRRFSWEFNRREFKLVRLRDGRQRVFCVEPPIGTFSTIAVELPSFLTGIARVLDIGDGFDHWEIDEPSDAAVASDWWTTGDDLKKAALLMRKRKS